MTILSIEVYSLTTTFTKHHKNEEGFEFFYFLTSVIGLLYNKCQMVFFSSIVKNWAKVTDCMVLNWNFFHLPTVCDAGNI